MANINFLPPWVETNEQPAFYDKESGTVLQQTARMYAKVNQLVRSVNEQNETIADYIQQFIDLHDYVEDYFTNLDVQEEVNNKIEAMSDSGELLAIMKPYIDPIFEAQNDRIDIIDDKVDNAVSGAPAGVYATVEDLETDDPDHDRIYVVRSDGVVTGNVTLPATIDDAKVVTVAVDEFHDVILIEVKKCDTCLP